MRPVLKNLLLAMFVVALIPLALLAFPLLAARLLARHLSMWTRGNAPAASMVVPHSNRADSRPSGTSDAGGADALRGTRTPGLGVPEMRSPVAPLPSWGARANAA